MSFLCEPGEYIQFADDTCLIYVHENLEHLVEHVNRRLSKILDWCRYNKLSLNPSKSEYLLISNRKPENIPQVYIGPDEVTRKNHVKYLGLEIDDKLKFQSHLGSLGKKLSRLSGVSSRLMKYFNYNASKSFYYSCVYSALTYCISVWGGTLQCNHSGDRIVKLQKRIVKNLFAKFSNPDLCIFKSNRLLKLGDIHKLYVAIHMFKLVKLESNETLDASVQREYPEHAHNTRNRNNMITPFPRVDAIKVNYKYQFKTIWNEIPSTLSEDCSLGTFKRKVIEHYIYMY